MKITGVIVAAGSGKRMGAGMNKVYMPLFKESVLYYTLKAFKESESIDEIVLVTGKEDFYTAEKISEKLGISIILTEGGKERQDSVLNGTNKASGEVIAIHDGARALITPQMIDDVIADAKKYGAASIGVIPKDTIKETEGGFIKSTLKRENSCLIGTPQVFRKEDIIKAHKKAKEDGFLGTDDCSLVERLGIKIKVTEGSYENIKITTPEDIYAAERILAKREAEKCE